MDYTTLSLNECAGAIDQVAHDAVATFGTLDARQLNWRPEEDRWSVGQCFQHLLTANELMIQEARSALRGGHAVWQRLPWLTSRMGPALIRSQSPTVTRKYKAPLSARPTASAIAADIIERFADQQRNAATWFRELDESRVSRTIMTSPFLSVVAYSVLDGCRLMVAHDHRHFEQARRVTTAMDFPHDGPLHPPATP